MSKSRREAEEAGGSASTEGVEPSNKESADSDDCADELYEEPGAYSGPAEPIKQDDGTVLICDPEPERDDLKWVVPVVGKWRCERCETIIRPGISADGKPMEPHECQTCERQGPFTHMGDYKSAVKTAAVGMAAADRPTDSMWFPSGEPKPVRTDEVWSDIRAYIKEHWSSTNETNYDLLTAWAVSTWFRPELEFSSHLFLSGQSTGGKTRLLNTLARVSYRGVVTASTSSASMYRMIDDLSLTFLVSEYHGLDDDEQQKLDNVIRAGQKRNEIVTRSVPSADGGWGVGTFNTFTHAGIAAMEEPADDIVNRCIQIHSRKAADVDLPEKHDEETAKDIRSRMLHERFRYHDSDRWDAAYGKGLRYCEEHNVTDRTREKVLALLTPAYLFGKVDELGDAIESVIEDDHEAISSSEDANVIRVIRDLANEKIEEGGPVIGDDEDIWDGMKIYNTEITSLYNQITESDKSYEAVSEIWRNLGLEYARDRDGSHISDKRLKEKLERECNVHGIDLYGKVPVGRIVKRMPEDEWWGGDCPECGYDRTISHKHADGYKMCGPCAAELKEMDTEEVED